MRKDSGDGRYKTQLAAVQIVKHAIGVPEWVPRLLRDFMHHVEVEP